MAPRVLSVPFRLGPSRPVTHTDGTSVCAAIALAAIEHSTLCQDQALCKDVGFITRDNINLLYAVNLADLCLEGYSAAVLLLLIFPCRFGGARRRLTKALGFILLAMLVVDVVLENMAIHTAKSIQPTVKVLKNSDCLNQLLADGRTQQETLIKLESHLETIVKLGYAQLGVAAAATAGELKELWDANHGNGMGPTQRMFFIFVPAVTDVILAALDFLIFTASAHADNVAVRESIVNRGSIVNRTSVWCVTITDECVTIAENEATRLGIDRPLDNPHLGLWVSVASVVPVISFLFFALVCMCPRDANPGGRPNAALVCVGNVRPKRATTARCRFSNVW